MIENRFWKLLAKKFSNEASRPELEELEGLLREHPDRMYHAQQVMDIWKLKKEDNLLEAEYAYKFHEEYLKRSNINFPFKNEIKVRKTQIPFNSKAWVFAECILLIFSISILWIFFQKDNVLANTNIKRVSQVQTKLASKTKVLMPDGSVVWLNAGSTLVYDDEFGIKHRKVVLVGEGYFDVKKSKEPFIIETDHIQIKVLGTVFNVKAYKNERTTETSLIHGKVEVTINKRPGEMFILSPNEKLIVANGQLNKIDSAGNKSEPAILRLRNVLQWDEKTIAETSWVQNKLVFSEQTFEDLVLDMERWYGVEINIDDEELKKKRFTGVFVNESVKQVLDALQISTPFNYNIGQDKIQISK